MDSGRNERSVPRGWTRWLGPVALAVLGIVAYRALWFDPTRLAPDAIFFTPGGLPPAIVVAVAAWTGWRRSAALRTAAIPAPSVAWRVAALPLLALGCACFAWAYQTGKSDLLLVSLAALATAWAMRQAAARGLRASLLPSAILLLGLRIPKPLEDEIVWALQNWTARSAKGLLDLAGFDFVQSGVILRNEAHTFQVIDTCSGLNGIVILVLVGLIVRELFEKRKGWSWGVVAAAPPLGFALNGLRVAYVAASPDPEALAGVQGDHTPQGLAVLMAGTLLLYGLGALLARRSAAPPAERGAHDAIAIPQADARRLPVVGLGLAGLALLSWTLPRFALPPLPDHVLEIDLPPEKAGWSSQPAPHDPFFTGVFTRSVHRRYERHAGASGVPDIVDVLIGYEAAGLPSSTRLLSSKMLIPGPEWELERQQETQIWLLERAAQFAVTQRRPGGERAVAFVWRPRDRGLLIETWRALWALDASPYRRSPPRRVVRMIAYAPRDGPLLLDRARQRLDRFIRDFRDDLAAL